MIQQPQDSFRHMLRIMKITKCEIADQIFLNRVNQSTTTSGRRIHGNN